MAASAGFAGWWEIDLDTLSLPDGRYEYEFIRNGDDTVAYPDPYADTITRFARYRGLFTMAKGKRIATPLRWDDEFPNGSKLANNNQIVIYEMPLKWMSSDATENPSWFCAMETAIASSIATWSWPNGTGHRKPIS